MFYKVYIEDNKSVNDIVSQYKVTKREVMYLIKEYDCKKPKNVASKICAETKQKKYGSATYNNRESAKTTCLEKYGVDNVSKVKEFTDKGYQTKCVNNGVDNPNNWRKNHQTRIEHFGSLEESYRVCKEHREITCLSKYGVTNISKLDNVKSKISQSLKDTFQEKYGADCYWLTENANRSNGSKDSSYNVAFKNKLDENNVFYEREIAIGQFIYDFKIGNCLIEINPSATHNSTWSPFSDKGIDLDYHIRKSQNAIDNGYRCLHIWEWDNIDKIVQQFTHKSKIYARKCILKDVSKKDLDEFLINYHLQGTCRNQSIKLGLYYNDELIQVMTFGTPRYNKNYEYELLRLCTNSNYIVVGGTEKLFKHFISNYNPTSIISYCDNSKFSGNTYLKLNMKLKDKGSPAKHWYNIKTKIHITDNLLRQQGYDRLFGTSFGKGTSNNDLMIQGGFVEIYDSGQSTYTYDKR